MPVFGTSSHLDCPDFSRTLIHLDNRQFTRLRNASSHPCARRGTGSRHRITPSQEPLRKKRASTRDHRHSRESSRAISDLSDRRLRRREHIVRAAPDMSEAVRNIGGRPTHLVAAALPPHIERSIVAGTRKTRMSANETPGRLHHRLVSGFMARRVRTRST